MPNIGGKIWFTAIAGLLLGFVLFGMVQRGCDASGQQAVVTNDRVEPPTRDYNAASRTNERSVKPTRRSNNNANNAKGRRSNARANARNRQSARNTRRPSASGRDRGVLERNERSRSRADAARKAELARLTRERTERYRERSRRARTGDSSILDPALRTSTTGSVADAVAQAAAETGAELRGIRGEAGSRAGGSGPGDVGGVGQNREGSGDGGPGDSGDGGGGDDPFAEIAALLDGLGLDQSFVDLIQQVVTGNAPPTNPFIDTGVNNDDDDTPTIPIDNNPLVPVDLTTPVLARWVPIDIDGCSSLNNQGYETRDLYLAFLDRTDRPVVSSTETNSIVILDGSFYQAPLGSNGPPPGIEIDDCVAFDSYLTIGRASPVFISAPDPVDWGSRLLAEWFALFGAEITQDRAVFGDDRHYIHVGRFTAESEAKIFGSLRVDFDGQLAFVEVPDWRGADTDGLEEVIPPALPKVASVGFTSTGVLAGSTLEGTVAVDRPAPVGGLLVSLSTDKPGRIELPLQVRIPEGEFVATFEIRTYATGVIESATITAFTANSQVSATLQLQAPALISFEALHNRLLDGQTTSAVIRLGQPADAGGTKVTLSVSDDKAVTLPSSVTIPAGHFRTVVTVTAQDVRSIMQATITAAAGGVTRTIEIEVVPTVSIVDGNSDGVIDTADLGLLLGAFGSDNPDFDFNGDGVVDTADLGLLNARFGERYDLDGEGPGENPGGGSDDLVIARWIDVSQENCDEFPGSRSVDLYIGFRDSASLPVISSNVDNGIQIAGGEFLQHPLGRNGPPSAVAIESFPCLAYDSYLTIGGSQPAFIESPDTVNWGSRLNAVWFSTSGEFEQDPAKFGDSRQYLYIGRFTADASASIAGSIRVDYSGNLAIVEIADWATASAIALDLNLDGQVDSIDVAMVTRAYGTNNPEYDFNGNGTVDGDDLRPLIDAIQQNKGL